MITTDSNKALNPTFLSFDRPTIKVLRMKIQNELVNLGKELGLSINVGNARFSSNTVNFKVEFSLIRKDGLVLNGEAEAFRDSAHRYGLKPEYLGKTFHFHGKSYTITGMKPRNHKFPILAERYNKKFKFTIGQIKSVFADSTQVTPWEPPGRLLNPQ